ncbi:unnamed protein product [Durusdinium trenchii]|uniref:RING-type domain-containing protein n=1 Tax=Durusdinium trenchii TaxID=1381693 RepID=A0ABP0IHB3_9DINO
MPKAKLKRPSKAKRKAKCKPEATNTVASTCEVERMRKVKEPFLDMFVSALTKGDPDPSEMAWHLTWRCIDAWRSDAPAACSLMLFSEALPGHVNLCDVLEAIDYHHYVRGEIGSDRWEERRVNAHELLEKLKNVEVSPRSFSVLHRAVSVACAWKDGPSEELKALSLATAKAVCQRDPEGACPICLLGWQPEDSVLVLSCNHVLHVDCFWKMITAAGSDALRGAVLWFSQKRTEFLDADRMLQSLSHASLLGPCCAQQPSLHACQCTGSSTGQATTCWRWADSSRCHRVLLTCESGNRGHL